MKEITTEVLKENFEKLINWKDGGKRCVDIKSNVHESIWTVYVFDIESLEGVFLDSDTILASDYSTVIQEEHERRQLAEYKRLQEKFRKKSAKGQ